VARLLVVLGGCSDGDDTSNASSSGQVTSTRGASGSSGSDASPPADDTDRVVEITVSVQDGKVSPKPRRVEVEKDSQIRLLVTGDVDDEVHVHGFDIEEPLEAGRTTTVEFVVNEEGVFEVETHESELELLQLEVH
jgi:hypothetical protein